MNLFIVFLLTGLWHGAAWTYVIFGIYHGVILIVERVAGQREPKGRGNRAARRLLGFLLVSMGWPIFRAESIAQTGDYYLALVRFSEPLFSEAVRASFTTQGLVVLALGSLIHFLPGKRCAGCVSDGVGHPSRCGLPRVARARRVTGCPRIGDQRQLLTLPLLPVLSGPRMRQPTIRITGTACTLLLFAPLLLWQCGKEEGARYLSDVERRRAAAFPSVRSPADLFDAQFYRAVDGALRDRLPFRGRVIGLVKRMELAIPGNTGTTDVLSADNGWYFLNASFGRRLGSPSDVRRVLGLVDDFLAEYAEAPPTFRLVVVADKHTVYPEYLNLEGREEARVYMESRELFHARFAGTGDPRIIDMRAIWRVEKTKTNELLFQPGDTHHTDLGAMVMAKAVLSSIRPGIWRDEEVVFVEDVWRPADLHNFAGITGADELHRIYRLEREGVESIATEWLDDSEDPLRPVRLRSASRDREMIDGRALVIHDSFIGTTLRPVFRQFFEDLTYRHIDRVSAADLRSAMEEFDVIIIEGAVRESTRTFGSLFSVPEERGGDERDSGRSDGSDG